MTVNSGTVETMECVYYRSRDFAGFRSILLDDVQKGDLDDINTDMEAQGRAFIAGYHGHDARLGESWFRVVYGPRADGEETNKVARRMNYVFLDSTDEELQEISDKISANIDGKQA